MKFISIQSYKMVHICSNNNPNNIGYEVVYMCYRQGETKTSRKRTTLVLPGEVPLTPPQTVRNMKSGTR